MTQRLCYSVPEAAAQLHISRSRLYELIHDGTIRVIKIGHRTLVAAAELEEYVERLRAAS